MTMDPAFYFSLYALPFQLSLRQLPCLVLTSLVRS
jgi:hypothetical protein